MITMIKNFVVGVFHVVTAPFVGAYRFVVKTAKWIVS